MIVISAQITSWEPLHELRQMRGGQPIQPDKFHIGDKIIIKTELGTDLAQIIKIEERPEKEVVREEPAEEDSSLKNNFVIRKAEPADFDKYAERNKKKEEAVEKAEEFIKKRKLPMKLVDVLFSLDGGRVTFAFTAPSRIDFRDLVKDLAGEFHKSIRFYQVGARQETGLLGDIGPCGRSLCCQKFLKKLGSVTTELIHNQQLSHRGPERLTGLCGRLKCCLAFEEEMYKELIKNLPAIGKEVKIEKGEGKVVDWHILKQTVVVEIEGAKVEAPISEILNPKS